MTLLSTNLANITVNQVPRAIDITVVHPGPGRTWQLQVLAYNPLPFNGPTHQVTHQRPKPPPRRLWLSLWLRRLGWTTWQLQVHAYNPLLFNEPTHLVTHQRPKPRRLWLSLWLRRLGWTTWQFPSPRSQDPSLSMNPPTRQLTRDQSHLPGEHPEVNCGCADWLRQSPSLRME